MRTNIASIQIRFSDIDWMGHVNNAVYLNYIENARIDFFNSAALNINWREWGIILARTEINYRVPAVLHDKLFVKTWCSRIGAKSFDLSFLIYKNENGEIINIADGITVLVCYDYSKSQSVALPQHWKEWLEEENKV
ncbi:MAG: acyl-CoA thioesterase [Bacteroidetes bacterium]|nr:acyl-CoA thioesterase [Bacteroidota bacterium]